MMRMVKSATAAIFALSLLACGSGDREPKGTLLRRTDCKGSPSPAGIKPGAAASQECVEYQYDGQGILSLRHVNAAFNCCPGQVAAGIQITGKTIVIQESEEQAGCHCNCLFDIDYQIENLKPGVYLIRMLTPYVLASEAPLEFIVDLERVPAGVHCIERNRYPWGKI